MIKDRLRFLALGFFISALFLSAYEVLMPSSKAEVNNGQHAESANDDINYKEQYESLLSEYEKQATKPSLTKQLIVQLLKIVVIVIMLKKNRLSIMTLSFSQSMKGNPHQLFFKIFLTPD